MRFSTSAALLGLSAAAVHASPMPYPDATSTSPAPASMTTGAFPEGYLDPTPQQITTIEQQAFGTLSDGTPPANISKEGITNLQLIAFNELFEVAFFNSLLENVTNHQKNYLLPFNANELHVTQTLKAIIAQEELHALNANGALKHFNATQIKPCDKYIFPTTSFDSAISLAQTFTSVVLGTLQDVVQIFAANGDAPLTRGVVSVVGQEGEQEGWFRLLHSGIPNELPFLTTGVRDFAFTALQGFAPAGACASVKDIPLKTFKNLVLLDTPTFTTTTIRVNITTDGYKKDEQLYLTYINQQNTPITEKLNYVSSDNDWVTLSAPFPYVSKEMNGLTIASVSDKTGPYKTADDVANEAIWAPAFIIVEPNLSSY